MRLRNFFNHVATLIQPLFNLSMIGSYTSTRRGARALAASVASLSASVLSVVEIVV